MKKLFKALGYILLVILLLAVIVLVAARFLAPSIIEKVLVKDMARYGYEAEVDVEIDKLSPFGIDFPLIRVDMGNGELELDDIVLDVESLLSSRHELRLNLGELKLNISDDLIGYLEANGVHSDQLGELKGRDLSLHVDGPYLLADSNDIYAEVDEVEIGFAGESGRMVFSTDGFKATATVEGRDIIVTPLNIHLNGTQILSFDDGIYSEGMDTLNLGMVKIHGFSSLPKAILDELVVKFLDDGIFITSSSVAFAAPDMVSDYFDMVITEPVEAFVEKGGPITVDTSLVLTGKSKVLEGLGLEFHLVKDGERFEIEDGTLFHKDIRSRLPFEFAMEGDDIEVEIAGSKRFTINRKSPNEMVLQEMASFALMKLASSLFGL